MLALGVSYGYLRPKAGVIPCIRELLTDKQLEDVANRYIVALHTPIKDSGGVDRVLGARRIDAGRAVRALFDLSGRQWDDYGVFAFLVPAST